MAAIQLSFSLRTSPNCKTVHLVGSWDNYNGKLPLSKDAAGKAGSWKGTFRFQGATVKQGQRYWYRYIMDGYHVSHDPAKAFTTEPTTGQNLNILDIPAAKSSSNSTSASSTAASKRHSRRVSSDAIAKGRALSPSKIISPKPVKPNQTRHITSGDYNSATAAVNQLATHLRQTAIHDTSSEDESSEEEEEEEDSDSDDGSDISSDVPSLSSSRSISSRASSVSSTSSSCTCERYGITRAGARVKLDCGGSRCGGSDDGDSCSSDDSEVDLKTARRQGILVRS